MRAALVGAWLWQAEPKAVGETDKKDGWTGESNGNNYSLENGYSRMRLGLQACSSCTRAQQQQQQQQQHERNRNQVQACQAKRHDKRCTTNGNTNPGTGCQLVFLFSLPSLFCRSSHILELPQSASLFSPSWGTPARRHGSSTLAPWQRNGKGAVAGLGALPFDKTLDS